MNYYCPTHNYKAKCRPSLWAQTGKSAGIRFPNQADESVRTLKRRRGRKPSEGGVKEGYLTAEGRVINQESPSIRGLFYLGSSALTGARSMKRRRGCHDGMAMVMVGCRMTDRMSSPELQLHLSRQGGVGAQQTGNRPLKLTSPLLFTPHHRIIGLKDGTSPPPNKPVTTSMTAGAQKEA